MSLYSSAPALRPFGEDKPTLLISWWITIFSSFVIALRLAGRYVRVEKLWFEDKVAACALIPLYMRMACVHVVLVYGTNNVQLENGLRFSDEEVRRRQIGSGLVLLTRILYPATLWILKWVTLHFFSRLINSTGRKRYYFTLMFMRISLAATFAAVVISDLAECRPFKGYWQVSPDPGPQCRQGVASLLTIAACNTITDLLLVIFPVPIIISSKIKSSRKIFLVLLFSLGLIAVVVSSVRVPKVLDEDGYQGTRTTWASVELLVATIVANTQVLGSFIRDTGVKKARFRRPGAAGYGLSSNSNSHTPRGGGVGLTSTHHTMTHISHQDVWGDRADEQNMAKIGMSTTIKADPDLESKPSSGRESEDSLIPKGHSPNNLSQGGGRGVMVVTTTRVEVTVKDRETGQQPRPPPPPAKPVQARSAGVTGRGRGSTKLLQVQAALPGGRDV